MGKEYSIYTTADPGPVVVELAAKLIENLSTVDTVHFVKWADITETRPGVFIPDTKEVYIDLGNILNSADLYRLGMMYTPGVFYTLLWTLFHEITHGRQCEEDPELAELILDAEDYEEAAQVATKDMVREWAEKNSIPDIKLWGWLGERISELINHKYAKGDLELLTELEAMVGGAVATVQTILATYEFDQPAWLYDAVNKGEFGLKIGPHAFLTATDFFGLDNPVKSVAKVAQTISM